MMEKTTFDKAFDALMVLEGVESDTPGDPGGYTRYGITARTWFSAHANHPPKPLAEITRDDAKEFYFQRYWVAPGIDRLERIAPLCAWECFEAGVNCGPATAVGFLQRALNFLNNAGLIEDGVIGHVTLGAVAKFVGNRRDSMVQLVAAQNGEQYAYYRQICGRSPGLREFAPGWMRRIGVAE